MQAALLNMDLTIYFLFARDEYDYFFFLHILGLDIKLGNNKHAYFPPIPHC